MRQHRFTWILMLAILLALPVTLVGDDEAATTQQALTPEQEEIKQLQEAQQKLTLEVAVQQAQNQKALAATVAETERLTAENALAQAQMQKQLAELDRERATLELQGLAITQKQQIEIARLELENQQLMLAKDKADLELARALADLTAEQQKLTLEQAVAEQEFQAELAEMNHQRQRMELANQQTTLELQKVSLAHQVQQQQVDQEIGMMETELKALAPKQQLAREQLAAAQAKATEELQLLRTQAQQRVERESWNEHTNQDVPHRLEPFVDGVLYISDRRVDLGEVILEGSAQYISERINFFNNQSTDEPIFLVIEDCVGGSVMEGFRIIKAIESSEAPVHVVAKSYAASMAATILARSENSYSLPDAVIMQHQMSSGAIGNMTQIEEGLKDAKRWQKRLLTPVAEKMGLTLDEFVKRMYEVNSEGEWEVFGDEAHELKWVNNVAVEVREEGITTKPTGAPRPNRGSIRC